MERYDTQQVSDNHEVVPDTTISHSETVPTATQFTEELSQKLGEESQHIKIHHDTQAVLEHMKEGVIVNLHMSRPRFTLKIIPEVLGLGAGSTSDAANRVISEYIKLGRQSLLPKSYQDQFASIENNARYTLNKYSLKSHWGMFVPVTAYQAWKNEHTRHAQAFWELVQDLRENYEEIRTRVLGDYHVLLYDSWTRMQKSAAEVTQHMTQEEYIRRCLTMIERAFPTQHTLNDQETFAFWVELGAIPLPSLLAQDIQQADSYQAKQAIKDAQARAELEKIEQEQAIESLRTRREREKIEHERQLELRKLSQQEQEERQRQWRQQQHEEELLRIRLQAEEDRLDRQREMEEDMLQIARQEKQRLVDEFFVSVVGQINQAIYISTENILESLEKNNGILRGPVSNQLRQLVQRLEQLNFVQDQKIEQQLQQLRSVLPSPAESEAAAKGVARIDTRPIERVVRRVHDDTKSILIDLETEPEAPRRVRRAEASFDTTELFDVSTRRSRTGSTELKALKKKPQTSRRQVRQFE